MPDLDLTQPLPDRAHEAIRVAVLGAIEDLRLNVADIQAGFELIDMLSLFIGDLLTEIGNLAADISALNIRADAAEIRENTAQAGIDGLQDTVADLVARVAALEADGAVE